MAESLQYFWSNLGVGMQVRFCEKVWPVGRAWAQRCFRTRTSSLPTSPTRPSSGSATTTSQPGIGMWACPRPGFNDQHVGHVQVVGVVQTVQTHPHNACPRPEPCFAHRIAAQLSPLLHQKLSFASSVKYVPNVVPFFFFWHWREHIIVEAD